MKLAIVASLFGSAAAFAPIPQTGSVSSALNSEMVKGSGDLVTKADLIELAEKSNPVLKYWDPIDLTSTTIFGESNEATISFLRHAEIKHSRVAMAAFVGYLVQSNGIQFPWRQLGGDWVSEAGLSPPEQWDSMPDAAKFQIIGFIGFLELFSESAGTHYMRGGTPGSYPNFSDYPDNMFHSVPFNLFDPFKLSKNASAEKKELGLIKEMNNGRLAMMGIIGCLTEQKVEGSVPLIAGLLKHYDGEVMNPLQSL